MFSFSSIFSFRGHFSSHRNQSWPLPADLTVVVVAQARSEQAEFLCCFLACQKVRGLVAEKKTQFQNNSTTTTTLSRAQRKNKNKKLANKTIEKRKKNKTRPGRKKSPRRKHALWTGREKERKKSKEKSFTEFFRPRNATQLATLGGKRDRGDGGVTLAGSRTPGMHCAEPKNLCKNNNRSRTTQHTFRLLAPPFPDSGRRQTSFRAGQGCQPASSKITQQSSSTPAAVTVLKQCQAVPQGWDWVSSQH